MTTVTIYVENCGTHPDQARYAYLTGPDNEEIASLKIGEEFHVTGQPENVRWRIISIVRNDA